MFGTRAIPGNELFEHRRQHVIQQLATDGFDPQSNGIFRRRSVEASDDDRIERFRQSLQNLGRVFASFGLYLSSRPDLLTLTDCLALAKIPDRSLATPPDQIRQILQEELKDTDDLNSVCRFVQFDPEPFESRLLFQLHYGELSNGDLVVVKLMHPAEHYEHDLKLLSLLRAVLSPRLIDSDRFGSLVTDFSRTFHDALDCRRVAESLEMMAHDVREMDRLTAPRVYGELCSHRILVTERLKGIRLDRYLAKRREQANQLSPTIDGIVADELARQLCDMWLRQVFDGTMLPIDVKAESILVRSPTEFSIVDAMFITLPRASKTNLLNYFVANATDEPSKSLTSLLKELDGADRRVSDSTLDRQFRQLVAFRDGGWEDGGRANCLSDTLFAQWRLAAQQGYRPLNHLTQVFRGTFHVAVLARQLAPDRDSLLEGVKDLRLTKLLHDMSTMMQPSYWGGQADRLAAVMMLGPRHLDEALKKVSEDDKSIGNHRPTSISGSWNSLIAVLLSITSLLLFRDKLLTTIPSTWLEPLSCGLFIILGAVIIRLLARSDSSNAV